MSLACFVGPREEKRQSCCGKMACEVSPQVFTAISSLNMDEILKLDESQVRVLLPSFVRIALCRSLDNSSYWVREKKKILEVLSNYEASNLIVTLLSIDFHSLELEVKREQQLRAKLVLQDDSKCLKLSDFIPLGKFSAFALLFFLILLTCVIQSLKKVTVSRD